MLHFTKEHGLPGAMSLDPQLVKRSAKDFFLNCFGMQVVEKIKKMHYKEKMQMLICLQLIRLKLNVPWLKSQRLGTSQECMMLSTLKYYTEVTKEGKGWGEVCMIWMLIVGLLSNFGVVEWLNLCEFNVILYVENLYSFSYKQNQLNLYSQ